MKREWLVFIGLTTLVILLRLPTLEEPFDNDSSGIAYHARWILRGEPLYSTHHPGHHLPAVYYTYTFAFMFFGDSTWSVKFLLIPWSILNAYLIYRLSNCLGRETGVLAAVFFIVLTSHLGLKGSSGEIEFFINLPRTAVVLLLLKFKKEETKNWKYIYIGLLSGIVFLFKAIYIDPIILSIMSITLESRMKRIQVSAYKKALLKTLWLGVGYFTALIPVILYFQSVGLLDRFLQVFELGRGHITSLPTSALSLLLIPGIPLYILGVNNFVLLWLSIVGTCEFMRTLRSKLFINGTQKLFAIIIITWYLLSWLEAGISRWGFIHYGLAIVPPLSIAAAWGLMWFHQWYKNRKKLSYSFSWRMPSVIILFAALSISVITNVNFHINYVGYKLGLESYQEFLLEGSPEGAVYASMQEMMAYIQSNTIKDEYVYCWCGNVQLYYYIDRRPPIETPWTRYAEAFGSNERIFIPQTKFIIVGENMFIPKPEWLDEQLTDKYELETIIQDYRIYRRIEESPQLIFE